jgi:hypothetical protein
LSDITRHFVDSQLFVVWLQNTGKMSVVLTHTDMPNVL